MRKNKLSDIIFGVLLPAFAVSCLNGCGKEVQSAADYVQQATTIAVVEEKKEEEHEIAVGDDEDIIVEIPETDIYIEESEVPETDVYESIEVSEVKVDSEESENVETEEVQDYDMASLEAVKSVCGLVAPVETSVTACHWDSYGGHPYDVVYDFGDEYMAYVDACDWSLVFDADYYASKFPMLALQYHYDEKELLFHFQTVGVREGRQGSEDFNVCAYAMNGDRDIQGVIGSDYEGYYLYYMLNYDTEKDVDTVAYGDMSEIHVQYSFRPTALQLEEMYAVNRDRIDAGADMVTMMSETCAFASYRAYLNAHDGWKAHDWAIANEDGLLQEYEDIMGGTKLAENTVTFDYSGRYGEVMEHFYYNSKDHYDAMVSTKYNYIGVSNVCNGKNGSSQFDFFIDAIDLL